MDSWHQLLILKMAQGEYLGKPVSPYNWWSLWSLAYETVSGNEINPAIAQTAPNEACTGIDDTPLA